jgi:hypothetical protein
MIPIDVHLCLVVLFQQLLLYSVQQLLQLGQPAEQQLYDVLQDNLVSCQLLVDVFLSL